MNITGKVWIGSLVLATTACAGNARQSGPEVGREPPGREVTVENWTGSDLRVYVYYGGDISLLGKVRPVSSRVVSLPAAAGGAIRLITYPMGGWETLHVSEPVHISFGQRVVWRLRATGGSAITYQPMLRQGDERVMGRAGI